ncbi:hypothetical protein ABT024_39995, partial [Streptomyces sp. NPDC002812]
MTARIDLVRRLGLPVGPDPAFDELATRMAVSAGFLYGMVNLFLFIRKSLGGAPAESPLRAELADWTRRAREAGM